MIAQRTVKRAALTSAITLSVLAVPTVYAWWTTPSSAVHHDVSEPAEPTYRQATIQAAPQGNGKPKAAHNARLEVITTKGPLERPDYRKFVVRLPHAEVPTQEETEAR